MTPEKKEIAKFLGNKVRLLRISKNMKQKELTAKLGMTQAYLSDLERGRTMIPTNLLFEISKIFGISLSYFDFEKGTFSNQDQLNHSDIHTIKKRLNYLEKEVQEINSRLKNEENN